MALLDMPQLLLNGKDYRRGIVLDDFGERVGALNRDTARATIRMRMHAEVQNERSGDVLQALAMAVCR